ASADFPNNFDSPEVRAQYSTDNLLRLGKLFSPASWREQLNNLRNMLRRRRDLLFDYGAFGNPAHEDSTTPTSSQPSNNIHNESQHASISLNTLSSV
uniref:Uncharacterized protein n=1 Tax=Acrobeloides nanus TaxID=290746 RepID=A0A914D281_9BILA